MFNVMKVWWGLTSEVSSLSSKVEFTLKCLQDVCKKFIRIGNVLYVRSQVVHKMFASVFKKFVKYT